MPPPTSWSNTIAALAHSNGCRPKDKSPGTNKRDKVIRIRFAVTRFRFPDRQQIFPALLTREFRGQAIEFSSESRGALAISSPKSANFPVFSRETGNQRAETGSLMTASSAKNQRFLRDLMAESRLLYTVPSTVIGGWDRNIKQNNGLVVHARDTYAPHNTGEAGLGGGGTASRGAALPGSSENATARHILRSRAHDMMAGTGTASLVPAKNFTNSPSVH
jgi:hypothetical protein